MKQRVLSGYRIASRPSTESAIDRTAFLRGCRRIKRIRERIRRDSRIGYVPKIDLHADVWRDGKNFIWGETRVVRRGTQDVFVACVSAPVVLSQNTSLVRALLVHEFSHCFHFIREAMEAQRRGSPLRVEQNPDSAEWEAATHIQEPERWFAHKDLPILPWNDPQLAEFQEIAAGLLSNGVDASLPDSGPPLKVTLYPPDQVRAHLDRL